MGSNAALRRTFPPPYSLTANQEILARIYFSFFVYTGSLYVLFFRLITQKSCHVAVDGDPWLPPLAGCARANKTPRWGFL